MCQGLKQLMQFTAGGKLRVDVYASCLEVDFPPEAEQGEDYAWRDIIIFLVSEQQESIIKHFKTPFKWNCALLEYEDFCHNVAGWAAQSDDFQHHIVEQCFGFDPGY